MENIIPADIRCCADVCAPCDVSDVHDVQIDMLLADDPDVSTTAYFIFNYGFLSLLLPLLLLFPLFPRQIVTLFCVYRIFKILVRFHVSKKKSTR